MPITTILLILVLISVAVMLVILLKRKNNELNILSETNDNIKEHNLNLEKEKCALEVRLESMQQREQMIITENEKNEKRFKETFQNLANDILKKQSSDFLTVSSSEVVRIVSPLQKELEQFKQHIERQQISSAKESASLQVELKRLFDLNNKLSDEAISLTKAIKGEHNPKLQGDWGEMILDRILTNSGLVKNEHYFVQESSHNDDGKIMRPDVIVRYPDGREVIVDSKVSLTAYSRYISAQNNEDMIVAENDHITSVKKHIDELSSKGYDISKSSLDFVMMFMPIEPAYILALKSDNTLWEYAYKKKILLVSPTHLITALKLVYDLWSRDAQNKNALEIAQRGALMYDKFVAFVSDMENIGKQIDGSRKQYDTAMNKLCHGNGNLLGQMEKLRQLGVRGSKKLETSKE